MKHIFLALALFGSVLCAQAQLKFGIKAGPNFSDVDGNIAPDTKMRTSFHFGALAELKLPGRFALQPELLYSSQGAEVESAAFKDIQYDYITVPVMLKYYLIPDLFNIELGPQFSFLINDNQDFDVEDSSTFDFAALGGVGVDLGQHFFVQGRYVLGLTDASSNADIKNRVIQLSLGYKF
ncbi:porin family protein [Flavobacterium sp.]|uniref:porin family protein n=1 Tax=Flavobacterium sp. TaxID=239 RepID=UPI0039E56B28